MFAGFRPIKPLFHVEADKLSDEERYWNRLKEVSVFQEAGNITSTDFLPTDPYYVASTCSNRLSIYDTKICEPIASFSRIKSPLLCVLFRPDSHLVGVGTQDGNIHFFDVVRLRKKRGLKHPIRSFNNAHKYRVNAISYAPSNLSFASMSDDCTVKIWDLSDARGAEAKPIWEVESAHSDHVRSGVFSTKNNHLLITSSYDHTIKIWDVRTKGKASNAAMEMNHGKPIEKLLFFPSETIVASAGENTVKLWDIAAGGKLMHTIENHHKTITSICFATNKTYLLSGGLDRRINLYRCNSGDFALVKSWKTAAHVLSLSMSPDDQVMAYGMSNLLSIYRRKSEKELAAAKNTTLNNSNGFLNSFGEENIKKKKRLPNDTPLFIDAKAGGQPQKRYFSAPVVKQRVRDQEGGCSERIAVEFSARQIDKLSLGVIDNLLRQRKYKEFFKTAVLKCSINNPEMTVAALQQLRIRQKLFVSMSGHNEKILLRFIEFLQLNLFNGTFFDVLFDVMNTFLTIYTAEVLSTDIITAIEKLKDFIFDEIEAQKNLSKLIGIVQMLTYKSVNEKIENAEDKAITSMQNGEDNLANKPLSNGFTTDHGQNDTVKKDYILNVILVDEKAAANSKKVEWVL